MITICATRDAEYAVCFDSMRVFKTHKISRIAESYPVKFRGSYFVNDKLPADVLLYLLPLYANFLQRAEQRKQAQELVRFLNYDLDDTAARNFNSFTGSRGE